VTIVIDGSAGTGRIVVWAAMTHVGMLLATLTPGHVGGSETYVRGLLGAYAAGDGPATTTLVAHAPAAAALGGVIGERVRLHPLRGSGPAPGGARRAAWLVASVARPGVAPGIVADVVHAPLTIPVPRVDAPLVITVHDVAHHELPASFSAAERAFRRVAYDRPARHAALVITDSEHARAAIVERLGIGSERVVAIHLGIDHARLRADPQPADEERLAALRLPPRFVLYPANLWPHKNHERLLAGLAAATDRELALVLTGRPGPRLRRLRELAAGLGLADRVLHLGYLPADVMPALYRRATGLVFPSLHEGFGAPTLEAMACGCPVAASGAGAVAEVTGAAALPFDARDTAAIGDALDRLAGDGALRERLRTAGPAHAARFTWARAAGLHAEAYERARRGA
jgi:glycosyltransferase involved in cell wall biosynthesis